MADAAAPIDHDKAFKAGLLRFIVMSAALTAVFAAFLVAVLVLGWFGEASTQALLAGSIVFAVLDVAVLFVSGFLPALIAKAKANG